MKWNPIDVAMCLLLAAVAVIGYLCWPTSQVNYTPPQTVAKNRVVADEVVVVDKDGNETMKLSAGWIQVKDSKGKWRALDVVRLVERFGGWVDDQR